MTSAEEQPLLVKYLPFHLTKGAATQRHKIATSTNEILREPWQRMAVAGFLEVNVLHSNILSFENSQM